MYFKPEKSGFTLLEVVMVLVIIATLAAIGLPKYIQLKSKVLYDSTDNADLAALNVAIKTKFFENITNGIDPNSAWPQTAAEITSLVQSNDRFTVVNTSFANNSNDNLHWRIMDYLEGNTIIFCPHWNGNCGGPNGGYAISSYLAGGRGNIYHYYHFGGVGGGIDGRITLETVFSPGH